MPKFENITNTEQAPDEYIRDWAKASGAQRPDLLGWAELSKSIPKLPKEPIEAAKNLRLHLIKSGFNYSEGIFTLPEVLQKKRGNCLGYSLLYASLLSERGFKPEFKILTHPHDAVDAQDRRLFQELSSGEYFSYDKPKLPKLSERATHPINRFTPLNHPMLMLNGCPFEPTTTDKEAIDENPVYLPTAETERDVSISELTSFVYVDRAKQLFQSFKRTGKGDLVESKLLAEEGLKRWKDNRDGWGLLWELGEAMGDKELQHRALSEYERIGGNDSGFFYTMYHMTGKQESLDQSLEHFPENIPAFLDKHVFLEKDGKEARFNLAVGMWCVCNSTVLNLEDYYTDATCRDVIRKLYGRNATTRLFQKKV